jgi:hypothetical protein
MAPWAVAGDKIEFSSPAPAIGWSVPQREIEQKDKEKAPADAPHFSSYQPAEIAPAFEATTVVVTRSREMDKHAWDLNGLDSRLSLTPDLNKKKLTVLEQLLEPETRTGATNGQASARNDHSFGDANDSRSKKEPEKMEASKGQLESENLTLFGQEKDSKEDRFGDRYAQSLDSVPWMKGLQDRNETEQDRTHHLNFERMHRGDFVEFDSEKNPFEASEAASGFEVGNRTQDPLRASAAPPSASPAYSSLPGSLSGANAGEAFSARQMSSAWGADAMPAPAAYSSPPIMQPAWSSGVQYFGAPSTLPFPHRPGSPFQ